MSIQNPILLRFVGLDRLFGSHYDEYVIEYSDFQTTVDATVFDYAKSRLIIRTLIYNIIFRGCFLIDLKTKVLDIMQSFVH